MACLLMYVFLMLVMGCHKVERNNPFDPALTPAVEIVEVRDDPTSGTVTLRWTQYEGDQPFARYLVIRRLLIFEVPVLKNTLKVIQDIAHTSFVDTTRQPNTDYDYQVAVVNTSGFEHPSEPQKVSGYTAGPVVLLDAAVNPQEGSVTLRWTQFRGDSLRPTGSNGLEEAMSSLCLLRS